MIHKYICTCLCHNRRGTTLCPSLTHITSISMYIHLHGCENRHGTALREAAQRYAASLGGGGASVRAIMGRVTSHPATSYLVTGTVPMSMYICGCIHACTAYMHALRGHVLCLMHTCLAGSVCTHTSICAVYRRMSASIQKRTHPPTIENPTKTTQGSSDGHIRYWDFVAPQRCFTVSGLAPGQPSPQYIALVSMCFCVLLLLRA